MNVASHRQHLNTRLNELKVKQSTSIEDIGFEYHIDHIMLQTFNIIMDDFSESI